MSGIEIAGLVLAGFPLLISAAEHYREGFEPLVKWKRFRADFIQFIDAVDIQKQLFNLTLECLLRSADIEEDELQLFLEYPNYGGWGHPLLLERLSSRLGPSLGVFLSTINTMNGLMLELQALLLIKDGEVAWAKDGASKWDYQLKRIHLSFSKKGARTVESLKSHNRSLRDLLDSNEKLGGMKAKRRDTTMANIFECIRRHASSLHAAVRGGWSCQCAPHMASLRLEQRKTGDWDSIFNLAFGVPKDAQTVIHREVVISVRKESGIKDMSSAKFNVSGLLGHENNPHQALGGLNILRQNFVSKSALEVNIISRPILPASSSTPSSTSTYKNLKALFRNSGTNGTDCLLEDGKVKKSNSNLTKVKKSVRLDVPVDHLVLSAQPLAPQIVEIITKTEIKDLCSTIRSSNLDTNSVGFLSDGNRIHELRPMPTYETTNHDSYISLEEILSKKTGSRLSQQKRLKLASTFASSLLQLQTTPWLVEKFEKRNIFFYQEGKDTMLDNAYIRYSFPSTKSSGDITSEPSPPDPRFATRNSLSSLGILLLELCFGQPIEDQEEIRKHYLGADGKPHKGTDYMTARDWADMVWEEDPKLESIIKSCLFCMFEEKPDWQNKMFTQAVYASVVEPLDNYFVSKWPADLNSQGLPQRREAYLD